MRQIMKQIVLGGAALGVVSRTLPPTTFTLAALGLGLMLFVVLRRRRLMALAVI